MVLLLTASGFSCGPKAGETKGSAGETWAREAGVRLPGVTSSCTLVLDDGVFRTFYMRDGKIAYSDSVDGLTFDAAHETGIFEERDGEWHMLSNPAVIRLSDRSWVMVYELRKGEEPGPTGPGKPPGVRNLFYATSADGVSFQKGGVAIDSTREDRGFASVPDLVLLGDGSVRMYYVSGGEDIASAVSKDGGKTWSREAGLRLKNKTVDPDVFKGDEQWVMYYATLVGDGNRIRKAVSEDGLSWKEIESDILVPESARGVVLDPDVVRLKDGGYRMYFGEAGEGAAQTGGPGTIDLKSALMK